MFCHILFVDFINLKFGLGIKDLDGVFKDHLAGHLFTISEEKLFDMQVDNRIECMLLGTSSEGRLLAAAALPGFLFTNNSQLINFLPTVF